MTFLEAEFFQVVASTWVRSGENVRIKVQENKSDSLRVKIKDKGSVAFHSF